jgi:hypothetical protein
VAFPRCSADQGAIQLDPGAAQSRQQLGTARVRAAHCEASLFVDVFHDRTAVATREANRVLDDVGQHLVQHQAGADHLADVAQGLHLLDPPSQLRTPLLQRPHQVDIVNHDGRLRGEGFQQRLLPVVEGVNPGAVQGKASHYLAVEK